MKDLIGKTGIILIALMLLSAPLATANGEPMNDTHEEEEEGLELGVISGLITLVCVAGTVVVGRLMKKGKVKVGTHHTLAYTSLALALFHGIYNFITH
ncbi:MAG: hypothetical protein JSV10_00235 [Candidatus Zixiibacteriota bacterium]|nr:MAG: hypothetical protein JSV10_00235 [candidate division Zixibacteria bacterium]